MDNESFAPSSGSVYRDLGYDDPEGMAEKSGLVIAMAAAMQHACMTEEALAAVIGVAPDQVHQLLRGQFSKIPVADIAGYLDALEQHLVPHARSIP